ncbi:AEC family transporter [Paracoccus shanxieyensis]|uniref:AEC family transporter n=1 Tax=Paracoccus shanxieyensis TaxID=2675752 RepID=A0A6L6IZJ6_9RHOB|nr:AEC family transporter [Paracoccus shanxieyensis]MTH65008.1 AEC family transporter [Paracoccus shanxieyensis]MTH88088.1 AEC family transporter [Paracoccus shanxieyensis]
MTTLFDVILPVFLIIGFGYLVAWRKMFSEVGVDGLMRFAQNFAVPVLLFTNVAKLDMAENFNLCMWIAFYTGAFLSYFIGWAVARFYLKRSAEDAVAIGFCCLFSNSLLLGIPIMERAYGAEAIAGNVAIIAIHSPVLYTFGITMMEIARSRGQSLSIGQVSMRALSGVLHTPLIIGILSGAVVNLLVQAGLVVPQGFWAAADMMARAALPAALFGMGGVLYRYRPEGDSTAIALCCICSLVVHPVTTYGLGMLFQLPAGAMRSAVITAAMAPGVNAYLFAAIYNSAKRVAATTVLISTGLSILTIWFWIAVLP